MEGKSIGVSYLLLGMGIFGFAGLHRFYLGRPFTGLLWLLTFGVFGVGTFIDLFLVPSLVEEENQRGGPRLLPPPIRPTGASLRLPAPSHPARAPSVEYAVLQIASRNDGRVTIPMVALGTGLSLRKAEQVLERMCKDRHAELDVSTEGANLYIFPGLRSNEIFDIDSV